MVFEARAKSLAAGQRTVGVEWKSGLEKRILGEVDGGCTGRVAPVEL
jgi:hypothetical protein